MLQTLSPEREAESTSDAPRRSRERAGWWVGAYFGVVLLAVAVVHVGCWSDRPSDVDPINFFCALSDYDVSRDSPHPPGYPLYVGLGRLAASFVGPYHAYQAVNLTMLLAASLLLVVIGSQLASPAVGMAAGLLFATNPITLAATVTSECYICDALGSASLAAWGLVGFRRGKSLGLLVFGAIYFLMGMTRIVSCAILFPLAMAAIYLGTAGDRRTLAKAAIVAGLATIAAYVLTIRLVGGAEVYRENAQRVMGAAFRASSILGGAPLRNHLAMAAKLSAWFLALAAAPLLVFFAARRSDPAGGEAGDERPTALLSAAWIAPPLAFYGLIYYLKPTYQLIYLPALQLLLCSGADRFFRRRPAALMGAGSVAMILQLGFFLAPPPGLPAQLARLTRPYFAENDAAWRDLELAAADREPDTLLVFQDHLRLPATALRLLSGEEPFALLNKDGGMTFYQRGRWVPTNEVDLARYRRRLVVRAGAGRPAFALEDLPKQAAAAG